MRRKRDIGMDVVTYKFHPANLDAEETLGVIFEGRAEGPIFEEEGDAFFKEQGRLFGRFMVWNSTARFAEGLAMGVAQAMIDMESGDWEDSETSEDFCGGALERLPGGGAIDKITAS